MRTAEAAHKPHTLRSLAFAALGVVYGDIGTSPLYALKECFHTGHGIVASNHNILGILSLIFWSLVLIVVVKYLTFVMRADNRGEGGILALLALASPKGRDPKISFTTKWIISMGVLGAALLVADSTITPAISVLGAVEGVLLANPALKPAVPWIATVIIVLIFLLQKKGTATIGKIFAPFMVVWFLTIACLGVPQIFVRPDVLLALNPGRALAFFLDNGWPGFLVLGSVVLCVTGAEALYADMGHFGKPAISLAWYSLVMPSLLLNYFGQGALLLERGASVVENPFYELAPTWFLYPLVAISTSAAIIASQALISGAYSLAQQAVQLGFSPRITIIHTSEEQRGQIYIPEVNYLLMIACVGIVFSFKTSTNLAVAYGIAVVGTMLMTSILTYYTARRRWRWSLRASSALLIFCLMIDVPFLIANLHKIMDGAWVTLGIAAGVFAVMTTWKKGRGILAQHMKRDFVPISEFLDEMKTKNPHRVEGAAVFMTSNLSVVPPTLKQHFSHNKILHNHVFILSVVTDDVPEVPDTDRVELENLGDGIYEIQAHYGFMQMPNVPILIQSVTQTLKLNVPVNDTTYFLGRETLLTYGAGNMSWWRKSLFSFLTRNARSATSYFSIPPNRVVELGMQVEL